MPATRCSRSGETAIYAEFAFEGAVVSGNIVDGAANGISIVNFDKGGRMAVCSGNVVRNLSTEGPYPADAPGFGVGITVEADTRRQRQHGGERAALRREDRLGAVHAQRRGHRQRHPQGRYRHRRDRRRGRRLSRHLGQCDLRDAQGAILGYRWSDAVTLPTWRLWGNAGYAHLTVRPQPRELILSAQRSGQHLRRPDLSDWYALAARYGWPRQFVESFRNRLVRFQQRCASTAATINLRGASGAVTSHFSAMPSPSSGTAAQ